MPCGSIADTRASCPGLFEILIETPFGGATVVVALGEVVELEPLAVDAVVPAAVSSLVEPEALPPLRAFDDPPPFVVVVDPLPCVVLDPPPRALVPVPCVVVAPPPWLPPLAGPCDVTGPCVLPRDP
jgi:hypothetical protein